MAVRLYNVGSPPLDFYPVRQYRSALLARGIYYESPVKVAEKERLEALAAKPPPLEPPVTETLASLLYLANGSENLMLPRLMSIIFWLAAGVFVYLLARDLISPDAGIISTAFFLYLPYGVVASRSFQPDPLMILMFVATIFAVFRYYKKPSPRLLAAACALSAAAIMVKPVCIFPIFGAFVALRIPMKDIRKILFGRDIIIFAAASIVPTSIYYGYGIFIAGFLKHQSDTSFLPSLLTKAFYWKGWYYMASLAIGRWVIVIALLGVLMMRAGVSRLFMWGLWAGYAVFGLVFTYHVHTHSYYQLMLIPITALSIGVAASVLFKELARNRGILRLTVWVLLAAPIAFSVQRSMTLLDDAGFDELVRNFQEIGELVNHSPKTLILDDHYGDRVMYNARVAGRFWPLTYDIEYKEAAGFPYLRGRELLDFILSEAPVEYFIVTSPGQLSLQPDIKQILDNEYVLMAETPNYIIYDMRNKKP